MHHETRPDGTIREHLDVTACEKCGQPFERRLFTLAWRNCLCAGGPGHRVVSCLRPGPNGICHGKTHDPAHVIQDGPTASYGA